MPGRRPYRQVIDGAPRSPLVVPAVFRKSLSFRAAKGDVVLCTYPKSGSHWVQYIMQLIVNGGKPISSYNEFTRNFRMIGYMETDGWESPLLVRLFLTHQPLSRETMNKEAKYIYIARNPWDVCVSQFRMTTDLSSSKFEDGTFDEFFEPFIEGDLGFGSYFDHVASAYAMRDEPNLFFLTYEELKKDIRGTILRLASFIGERYERAMLENSQMLQNILEWSKPEHMKKVVVLNFRESETPGSNELLVKVNVTSKEGYGGDRTKFALVKEAKVGGWKEYFTPDLLARMEKKIQEEGDNASFLELWEDIRKEAFTLSPGSSEYQDFSVP
ncbi:sulfotransferase 2A8-like [Dermacentor andersoni]|uniref:sulfotransferase 2A8-like n=1 Tax=Dermacentor andersoni TaxID=34620 RepID=UPI0021554CE0|nr:sulfotransferase 2A8-like [Dermacentor andersoni]